MSDSKLFGRVKIEDIRAELQTDKKDKHFTRKKNALKRVVAAMTMGQDMAPLYPNIIACLSIQVIEIKKMVYLYLINYARIKPDMMRSAVRGMVEDANDHSALIRALAIRTMAYIPVPFVLQALVEPLRHSLVDRDAYVRKTAAMCVAKLYLHDRRLVEKHDFIGTLRDLLADVNPTVVAAAAAALTELATRSENVQIQFNLTVASRLVAALGECSEWAMAYILEFLMFFVPASHDEAASLAERVAVRLQHSNAAVVLAAAKVILFLMNYIADDARVAALCMKLRPPLVTLLSSGPEIQYVALRSIYLIAQRRPACVGSDVRPFFCRYTDPVYVKLAKLDVLYWLVTPKNAATLIAEFHEYAIGAGGGGGAGESSADVARKAVRIIGKAGLRCGERAARPCVTTLTALLDTGEPHIAQEAVVACRDLFRAYPLLFEGALHNILPQAKHYTTPESLAAFVWILGQYAERIEGAAALLQGYAKDFLTQPAPVQLALLTAVVKLFIKRPTAGQELVPLVLKHATEDVDNPDVRDRGYIYWRLLSTDVAGAESIVMAGAHTSDPARDGDAAPAISPDNMSQAELDRLLLHIGTLASLYAREPQTFVRGAQARTLPESAALRDDARAPSTDDDIDLSLLPAVAVAPPSRQTAFASTTMDTYVTPEPYAAPEQDDDGLLGEDGEAQQALNPNETRESETHESEGGDAQDTRSPREADPVDPGQALDPYASLARLSMDGFENALVNAGRGLNYDFE